MGVELTFDNETFRGFAFYAAICILKMFVVVFLTIRQRFGKKVFVNPEDVAGQKDADGKPLKTVEDDPDVERVRRNHLNDMENIFPFLLLGFIYVLTGPTPSVALNHFRVFAASRIIHTLAYQIPIRQPSRAFSFMAGLAVNISMAVQIIMFAA